MAESANLIARDLTSRLGHLAKLAAQLESEKVRSEASELAQRVSEGRFYVACVGQFKRGKSTLIGALVGEQILPIGFVPVTAIPTVIRYGPEKTARIKSSDGHWQTIPLDCLPEYVTEEHNPENIKGVLGAEVFVPSPLLSSGMCLVDTPGLGSVFSGNSTTTRDFIPHIDVALVVTGSDPPLAGEELTLVTSIAEHVEAVIVVLNKADKASDAERAAAKTFTASLLGRSLHRKIGEIFEISATEQLEHRGPQRDWPKLIGMLEHLIEHSGADLVHSAGERGLERLASVLLASIEEEKQALIRPLEESEKRIAAMKQTVADADLSLRDFGYLMLGEQRRLSDVLLERRKHFLTDALPTAHLELQPSLRTQAGIFFGPAYRRVILRSAQNIAERRVTPWLATEQQEAERQYELISRRFEQMGDDFIERLARLHLPELNRLSGWVGAEARVRTASRFVFRDFIEIAQPASPLRWLADLALGLVGIRQLFNRDAKRFLDWLFEVNTSRIQSDVLERVQDRANRLQVDIHSLLHEITRLAEQALEKARTAKEMGTAAVHARLQQLAAMDSTLVILTSREHQ